MVDCAGERGRRRKIKGRRRREKKVGGINIFGVILVNTIKKKFGGWHNNLCVWK